jgi:hypothetical protein
MVANMFSRPLTQYILGLVFLVSSSFALSNTEFTYNVIDGGIEVTGCVVTCPSDLVIPETIDGYSVTKIGVEAFEGMSLTNVSLPSTLLVIESNSFINNQLTNISFPDGLIHIANSSFHGNQLTNITIPPSVSHIGTFAFRDNQITSVYIPDSVTDISIEAFDGNIGGIHGPWKYLSMQDNLILFGCAESCPSNLIIPESIDGLNVQIIGMNAFENSGIEAVSIPDAVERISFKAFAGNSLTNISFSSNITHIGESSFQSNNLSSVTFSNGLTSIQINAFRDNQITNIVLPESVSLISTDAFHQNPIEVIYYCDEPYFGDDFESFVGYYSDCEVVSDTQYSTFDIDQSGSVDALSDGLILLRYFFGLRGDSLISGVISPDANRTSAADIEAYIESHMP